MSTVAMGPLGGKATNARDSPGFPYLRRVFAVDLAAHSSFKVTLPQRLNRSSLPVEKHAQKDKHSSTRVRLPVTPIQSTAQVPKKA